MSDINVTRIDTPSRQKEQVMNSRIARGRALGVALVMVMLAALLMALSGQNPAQTGLSEEALPSKHATRHSPQTFEDDGDIWMVRNKKMHLVNLTPDTAVFNDLDPAVSPDAGRIAFASDRDGDFEIYLANISTGLVQRVTDNAVDDRSPVWSPDGQWISYHSPHYSSPTHSGIFSAKVEGTAGP
jgi:dipeptidyl aminopeptidase/acylaminoacyl peptidase